MSSLDPTIADRLKRSADGLMPAVVQQHDTGEVLMLGWMDDEALARTLTTGRATYWSRSRREYWVKGETSGHRQWVKEVRLDCDGDTLLVKVDQEGPACHTGSAPASTPTSCWPPMADAPRRTFGPVVLLGVASAGLAALAGSRAWVGFDVVEDAGSGSGPTAPRSASPDCVAGAPLVAALAFVVLACWGVLLVTRGRVRRGMAVLAVVGVGRHAGGGRRRRFVTGPDSLRGHARASSRCRSTSHRTAWPWVGVAASARGRSSRPCWPVRLVPTWPEMGSRYDAPGSTPPPREETSLDLWRALDHGRDPTLPDDRPSDP